MRRLRLNMIKVSAALTITLFVDVPRVCWPYLDAAY